MSCYRPVPAVRLSDGSVKMVSQSFGDSFSLPCGQCVGCRLERSRQWAVRCLHESQMHEHNCFVTLTYDDDNLPENGSLRYRDFQLFMKRLRKRFGSDISFYAGGEYGETTWRPHFHACLFGVWFPDSIFFCKSPSGERLYRSALLEKLWPFGMSSIGAVTFQSAAYIARYCMKKVTGDAAKDHYTRVLPTGEIVELEPEFARMSLNPAVGKRWFDKYLKEVYPRDFVIVNGKKVKPPKAYDEWLKRMDELAYDDVAVAREVTAVAHMQDNSYARLRVKEIVAEAKIASLKRSI